MIFSDWHSFWSYVIFLFYFCFLIFVFSLDKKRTKINLKITLEDLRKTFYCILLGVFLIILGTETEIIKISPFSMTLFNYLTIFTYFIFIVPIEEILFRGVIQTKMHKKYGSLSRIVVGSLIFGLVHLPNGAQGMSPLLWNWSLAGVSFFGGLMFGFLFMKTKSIIHPIIAHGVLGSIYLVLLGGSLGR